MTREEAIQEFQNVKDLIRQDGKDWFDERDLELIDMAIEALSEPINCVKCKHYYETEDDTDVHGHCKMDTAHTNLISRVDALKSFCIAPDGTRIPKVDCDNFLVTFSVEFIKKHLLSLPSADAVSREEYEEVKAYMNTLVDAFIEDGKELAKSIKVVRCNECKWYQGVHGVQGHAPCEWLNKQVLWNDFCSNGEPYKGGDTK